MISSLFTILVGPNSCPIISSPKLILVDHGTVALNSNLDLSDIPPSVNSLPGFSGDLVGKNDTGSYFIYICTDIHKVIALCI